MKDEITSGTTDEASAALSAPGLVRKPREGWEEQAKEMVRLGEDRIPDWENIVTTEWDQKEWEW